MKCWHWLKWTQSTPQRSLDAACRILTTLQDLDIFYFCCTCDLFIPPFCILYFFCICNLCYLLSCIPYFYFVFVIYATFPFVFCISVVFVILSTFPAHRLGPAACILPSCPLDPNPLCSHTPIWEMKKTQFSSGQKLDKLTLHQALPTVSPPLLSKQMHQIQDTVPPSHCSRPPKNLLEKGFHERFDKHLVLSAGPSWAGPRPVLTCQDYLARRTRALT